LFLWLAGGECARTFATRTNVETIELAEVGIAHDLEAPQQRQAQAAANSAHDFPNQREAAQRLNPNLNPRFFLRSFHPLQSKLPGARLQPSRERLVKLLRRR